MCPFLARGTRCGRWSRSRAQTMEDYQQSSKMIKKVGSDVRGRMSDFNSLTRPTLRPVGLHGARNSLLLSIAVLTRN